MIILTSTDKIQVKLGGSVTANQLECFASYRDTTSSTITPGKNALNTNNATAQDLVGSPAGSTQRIVDYLSIYNADTATATVTIQYDISGTSYILTVASLLSGEKLEYQEGAGFRSLNSIGALKQGNVSSYNNITPIFNSVVLASDVINSNAVANTIQDVTGLSFSVTTAKTYYFRFIIPYTSAATTTGGRFSINGPSITSLYYESNYNLGPGSVFTINTGLSTYDLPAASNTGAGLTGNVAVIDGILVPAADGTLIARFASEVANSAITAKAGAIVYYKQLD